MRILQIFPGKVWGGAEQYILDLSKALLTKGHNVMLLSRNSKAVTGRLDGELPYTLFPFRGSLDLRSALRLAAYMKGAVPDVVHIHDTSFVPVAVLAKIISRGNARIVLTRHIARRSRVFPLFRPFFKSLHRVIFVSGLAKKLWQQANGWMPEERLSVVHNSIPDEEKNFGAPSLRKLYGIGGDTPLIVFTGRIRKSKGCTVLIEALSRIRQEPFQLVFVGRCKPLSYEKKLRRLARSLGLEARVSFYGFATDVRSLIREADIGVAPSIVREACPLSPMEFMQAGKCVIATNNGAQPEYIKTGETGLLVAPGDVVHLADSIKAVLEDKDFRLRLGKSAKDYFETHMNYGAFLARILAAYS